MATRKTSTRPQNELAVVAPQPQHGISTEQIARRAYELYLARGGSHGSDLEDWLKAERELSLARKSQRAP